MAYAYLQRKAILIPSEKKSANSAALCNAKVTLKRTSTIHMLQQEVSIME